MCACVCGSDKNHTVGMWAWPNSYLPDVYLQLPPVGGANPSVMDSGSKTGKVYLRPHKAGKVSPPVCVPVCVCDCVLVCVRVGSRRRLMSWREVLSLS